MNKTNTNSLSQGQLVHALKRRVRIIAPVLQKAPERAYILEILLKKRDGILAVRTVPDIASVTINFDPQKFPKANLLKLLDALLANLGQRTKSDFVPTADVGAEARFVNWSICSRNMQRYCETIRRSLSF